MYIINSVKTYQLAFEALKVILKISLHRSFLVSENPARSLYSKTPT